MNIQTFQKEAARTLKKFGDDRDRQHMILGVISEIGELAGAYKKTLAYGKPLDFVNIAEEVADGFWYIACWATLNEIELQNLQLNSEFAEFAFTDEELASRTANPADALISFLFTMDFNPPKVQTLADNLYTTWLYMGYNQEQLENAFTRVISKLKIRFPEKFTEDAALNRDLISERNALENN